MSLNKLHFMVEAANAPPRDVLINARLDIPPIKLTGSISYFSDQLGQCVERFALILLGEDSLIPLIDFLL